MNTSEPDLQPAAVAHLRNLLHDTPYRPQLHFICLGNICRSPFAGLLMQERAGDAAVVHSAGTIQYEGRPSPADARLVAKEFGIDLSAHGASFVDIAALNAADAVFIFDDRNAQELANLGADGRNIIRLGHLIGVETIADPFQLGPDAFRHCYQQISEAVNVIAQELGSK